MIYEPNKLFRRRLTNPVFVDGLDTFENILEYNRKHKKKSINKKRIRIQKENPTYKITN